MHRIKHLAAIILGRDKQILACEAALVYRSTNELFVRVDCGIARRAIKTKRYDTSQRDALAAVSIWGNPASRAPSTMAVTS
jgi:hypothetical protein